MATHSSILAAESHGQRSLPVCSPWGGKELDTTKPLMITWLCFSAYKGNTFLLERKEKGRERGRESGRIQSLQKCVM